MSQDALEWVAKVGCTGGPLMVVDRKHLAQWTGAIPFRVLRERSEADAVRFADRRTVLHFWGNLGGAGEQFVECESEAEALAKLAGLHRMAKENCPAVIITEEEGLTHFRDPASGGELRAELEPKSEYDASWQNNIDADAWVHTFGDDARALFWFVGDNLVHVGCSTSGDELVLLTHTVMSHETRVDDHAAACAYVAAQRAGKPVAELDLSTPRAVVIWAPIAASELKGFDAREIADADAAEPTPLGTDFDQRIGTVLRINPGRYLASFGSVERNETENRRWSARWCRLTREVRRAAT